jgi:hypothetical protein
MLNDLPAFIEAAVTIDCEERSTALNHDRCLVVNLLPAFALAVDDILLITDCDGLSDTIIRSANEKVDILVHDFT